MSRPPKEHREPMKRQAGQTVEEMALQLSENQAAGNHLYQPKKGNYKEISDQLKTEALAAAVDQQIELLRQVKTRGKIDLDNIDEVSACAEAYMDACKRSGTFPTMLAFASATGWSRQALYLYISKHNNRSSQYLDSLRSAWAAILAQMGLARQSSESVTIFLLKNAGQGLVDKTELDVTAKPVDPLGERQTTQQLMEKYSTIIDLDD